MIKEILLPVPEFFIKQYPGEKSGDILSLKKNQILDAKVLKILSSSKAEMLIAGKKVLADTSIVLKKGQDLKLRVTDQNKLQVIITPENLEKKFRSIFPLLSSFSKQGGPVAGLQQFADVFFKQEENFLYKNADLSPQTKAFSHQSTISKSVFLKSGVPMGELQGADKVSDRLELHTIKKLFFSLALKSEKAEQDFLPNLLDKSGLMWERKINNVIKNESFWGKILTSEKSEDIQKMMQEDLKGAVLNLLETSDGEPGEGVKALSGLAENIEKLQLLNFNMNESGKYLLPFPFFQDDMFRFGQLFIDLGDGENKKNNKEDGILKVSLLLDMSELGPLRADFSFLKQNITGTFYVSDEETSLFIKGMIPDLAQRLKKHDFVISKIDCRVLPSERLSEAALIEEIIGDEQKGFNLIV